jgi:hypothetical protein
MKKINITAEDIRDVSRRRGVDPELWNYVATGKGDFSIRKGILSVGEVIFEDHAKLIVDFENKRIKQ